ncbi:DUF2249 domain-containing protein [Demequina muriae]|uniref:DUF2249 domain-containing protein n=1 Tax=Demequina muriae TaxID=3051664 RepID=A0ABT8GJA8_9MICO|nr:DUF2249 domain-containing protein [Demequina sp. EGI L300058]MDN4481527.1 DUF2249 domain-containing protein [Demequina sp. EGI L300058]
MSQDTTETAQATEAAEGCACGGGGCGSQQAPPAVDRGERTELSTGAASPVSASAAQPRDIDVRAIPHEHRHARVIGQVTSLVPGEVVVIAAPHAPERLLAEIDADVSGDFAFEYLQRGPEVWRVAISRLTCC